MAKAELDFCREIDLDILQKIKDVRFSFFPMLLIATAILLLIGPSASAIRPAIRTRHHGEFQITSKNPVLKSDSFRHYIEKFNQNDQETVVNYIPNSAAWQWIQDNVPLFGCPDKEIEEIYYFRWWTYRKHLRQTPVGFVISEFLPQVSWSKKFNTINCAAGHHFYTARNFPKEYWNNQRWTAK